MNCEGLVLVVLHGFAAAGGSFCGWNLREKHRPGNSGPVSGILNRKNLQRPSYERTLEVCTVVRV